MALGYGGDGPLAACSRMDQFRPVQMKAGNRGATAWGQSYDIRSVHNDRRPSWPRNRAGGATTGLCRTLLQILEIRQPMPSVLQQQGSIRPLEHQTVHFGAKPAQCLSLSVCQLSALVLPK